MTLDLSRPAWWSKDVPFDPTGKTQLGWAKEAAAKYRAAAVQAPTRAPAKERVFDALKAEMGVTGVTGERHTVTESVTSSVTGVTDTVTDVTGVTTVISKKEKAVERTRRWRQRKAKEHGEEIQ